MTVKVSDVMRHVRNHFIQSAVTGEWVHQSGVLTPMETLHVGAWIAITGEDAPCGVYLLDENGGIPELGYCRFEGTVYLLAPPADFIRLCGDIACWAAANPDPAIEGEKLGAYSMNRQAVTWQEAFATALRPYMRMFQEVAV